MCFCVCYLYMQMQTLCRAVEILITTSYSTSVKNFKRGFTEGPGKRGHIVADTNVSPFAPGTQHLLRTQKMFLILFRNILWLQQMFPGLHNMETMLPRFQCFRGFTCYLKHAQKFLLVRQNG